MIFTSGSTGRPKGAMIRHEAICARLLWQRERVLGFGTDDASLFKAPLSFDISVNEVLLPLVSGGRLIVTEPGGERDPQYLLDLIARERVTFVYLVSSMLDVLLDLARGTDRLSGLRHVWCGGEVLTPDLFERFRRQLSTTLYHGYGPAEATIGVSHVVYRDDAARIATSIGTPNPTPRCTCWIRSFVRCRKASVVSCTRVATCWVVATWARPDSPRHASSRTRSATTVPASTAPATWRAGARTAASTSSAAPTTRSRSEACVSSSRTSRRRSRPTPPCGTARCWSVRPGRRQLSCGVRGSGW